MKKITKQQAYNIVRQSIVNQRAIKDEDLRELARYFSPAAPRKVKTAEEWVAMACAKNDVRGWLNYLYSHEGWLYGTDGTRMHRAHTSLTTGYYEPSTMLPAPNPLKEGCPHPILQRVNFFFPVSMPVDSACFDEGTDVSGDNVKNCEQVRYEHGACVFDKRLLRQACNSDGSRDLYFENERVLGHSEFGQFVVMGVR